MWVSSGWALVGRPGGQIHVLRGAVVGWGLTTALAFGEVFGVPPFAAAELLPVVEGVMVAKLNERMEVSRGRETR